MADDAEPQKLAIYVHWPYCARICPYCDFNVYKQKSDPGLTAAILSDLKYWRDWSGPREITSIHFGGGTPSLMRGEDIAQITAKIDLLWGLGADCEIALEANPSDADKDKWNAFKGAGVNRLSLGVQSFHAPALNLLGRDHSAEEAKPALALARDIFSNLSLDLIFGWQGQTETLLDGDLTQALSVSPDHISAYHLTVEAGTAFAKAEARGQAKAVDADQSAAFYEQVAERLSGAGYDHYEVSNFAKPKKRSQHNLAYWRGLDYIGTGPGAHGRMTQDRKRYATVCHMRPGQYSAAVKAQGCGIENKEALSSQSWGEEYILMGLRIDEGISVNRFEDITGTKLPPAVISNLTAQGFLIHKHGRIKASAQGRLVLNHITEKLLA